LSELQLALIAVAALVLLALYVNGKWQERRLTRRLRERMHGGVGDALLRNLPDRERPLEPFLPRAAPAPAVAGAGASKASAAMSPAATAEARSFFADALADEQHEEPDERGESDGDDGRENTAAQVTSQVLRSPANLLRSDWAEDPLLDCSLEIRCTRAVDGVSVIDAASILGRAPWRLPVHFVVWDGRHQQWVLPDRFGYYNDALASIQLADRRGRLEEEELHRFVRTVQELAARLDADVDVPDPARLLEQALQLDRLCARFDVRIGLTVENLGAAWTGPQLRNAAHEAEFVAVDNQTWVRQGEHSEAMYRLLASPAPAHAVTLELDIALAPVGARAFRNMVESAQALARILGGRVVDDNGHVIDAPSLDAIEAQLVQVYEDMRGAGIEPGSARARRLYFS
jgi:hypothetical protein